MNVKTDLCCENLSVLSIFKLIWLSITKLANFYLPASILECRILTSNVMSDRGLVKGSEGSKASPTGLL